MIPTRRRMTVICVLVLLVLPAVANPVPNIPMVAADTGTANPGVALAQQLTTITGIAISPLFGVSAVGAWRYLGASEDVRASLPWYAQPRFFGPALALVVILFLKDILLGLVPPAKKLFDALEVVENKLSATLIATPMLIASTLQLVDVVAADRLATAVTLRGLPAIGGGFAALGVPDPGIFLTVLLVAVSLAAFVVVWMVGHAVNLLILLSPFGFLDVLLKLLKMTILGTLVLATMISPYLGAVLSLVILYVAVRVAGWTWRLTVFGTVVAWDIVRRRHRMDAQGATSVSAFAARRLGRLKTRTFGRLVIGSEGKLEFVAQSRLPGRRRPEFVAAPYRVRPGLPLPRIVGPIGAGGEIGTLFYLPPRYRTREDAVARALQCDCDVADPLPRTLRGAVAWWRGFA